MDRLQISASCAAAWAADLRASPPPDEPAEDSVYRLDGESGQSLAEYALILALIAIIAIAGLFLFGEAIRDYIFETIAGTIQDVVDMVT